MPTIPTPFRRLVLCTAFSSACVLPLGAGAQGAASAAAPTTTTTTTTTPASAPAHNPSPAQADMGAITSACEQAARELLVVKGVPAADVKFNGAPVAQRRAAGDEQLALRGSGSSRGSSGLRTFDYTCNADPRTSEAVGMVMRDTTPGGAEPRPAGNAQEPDLTHLSPTVCESAIAVALKKRWPRVSETSFESATRNLKQITTGTAELRGRGRFLPEQGKPLIYFGYSCEFDTRNGRLLGSKLSG